MNIEEEFEIESIQFRVLDGNPEGNPPDGIYVSKIHAKGNQGNEIVINVVNLYKLDLKIGDKFKVNIQSDLKKQFEKSQAGFTKLEYYSPKFALY